MMRRTHTHSRQTLDAATFSASRWRISPVTLRKVEKGDPTVALGTAFEVATLLGIHLFGADRDQLSALIDRGRDRLALLPARVREPAEGVHDDF